MKNKIIIILLAVLAILLYWFMLYDSHMRNLNVEASKPYKDKIDANISAGIEKIYLKDIFDDIYWDKACLHEQYKTAKDSIRTCYYFDQLNNGNSATPEDRTNYAEKYDFQTSDFRAPESKSGLVLLDSESKKAFIFAFDVNVDGNVIMMGNSAFVKAYKTIILLESGE
jgi:hypothetical protein